MLMTVVGDIHGNLPALEEALQISDRMGIQSIINTGDTVGEHPFPNEVIQKLELYRATSAQGDMDRWVSLFQRKKATLKTKLAPENLKSVEWNYRHLRSEYIEYLGGAPKRMMATLEGLSICVTHGMPTSHTEPLAEDADDQIFQRQREFANVHIVACGKTHSPYSKYVSDTLFVNPGSLGLPSGGRPCGTFAIVDTDSEPYKIEFREVQFDEKRIKEQWRKFERA